MTRGWLQNEYCQNGVDIKLKWFCLSENPCIFTIFINIHHIHLSAFDAHIWIKICPLINESYKFAHLLVVGCEWMMLSEWFHSLKEHIISTKLFKIFRFRFSQIEINLQKAPAVNSCNSIKIEKKQLHRTMQSGCPHWVSYINFFPWPASVFLSSSFVSMLTTATMKWEYFNHAKRQCTFIAFAGVHSTAQKERESNETISYKYSEFIRCAHSLLPTDRPTDRPTVCPSGGN